MPRAGAAHRAGEGAETCVCRPASTTAAPSVGPMPPQPRLEPLSEVEAYAVASLFMVGLRETLWEAVAEPGPAQAGLWGPQGLCRAVCAQLDVPERAWEVRCHLKPRGCGATALTVPVAVDASTARRWSAPRTWTSPTRCRRWWMCWTGHPRERRPLPPQTRRRGEPQKPRLQKLRPGRRRRGQPPQPQQCRRRVAGRTGTRWRRRLCRVAGAVGTEECRLNQCNRAALGVPHPTRIRPLRSWQTRLCVATPASRCWMTTTMRRGRAHRPTEVACACEPSAPRSSGPGHLPNPHPHPHSRGHTWTWSR